MGGVGERKRLEFPNTCATCENTGKLVLLSKRILKTGETNEYHEAGTVWTLMGIEGKSFDREPQAFIRIDTRTGSEYHTVGSRSLETGNKNTPLTRRMGGLQSLATLNVLWYRQRGVSSSPRPTMHMSASPPARQDSTRSQRIYDLQKQIGEIDFTIGATD